MKKLSFLALSLLFVYCTSQKEKLSDHQQRISRIEQGLQPVLQIEGEEVTIYTIEDRLEMLGIPGMSIAAVVDGEIVWAKGYGYADIGEKRQVDAETMFLAGSISKPVAALRTHQLVEERKFDLDRNVNDYLTSWQLPDNEFTVSEKVTLRRIMNHTAGLTVWGFPGYDKGDTIPSVVDVLDGRGNTDSVRVYKVPGESWMYSGGGYTIMQLVISDVEQTSFPQTLQEHVLDPLGMNLSTFENPLPERYHSIAATGYRANGEEVEGKWPIYPEMAAAGLWTTPSQLIRYAMEVQQILQSREDGILDYETVEEMLTPGMNGHGLGPGVREFTFGHGGADEGFRADLIAWKDSPHAIVIMVNSDNGSIMREVSLAFASEYNLPGISADIRRVVKLPQEALEKYTGKYEIEELGSLEIFTLTDQLAINAEFLDDTLQLVAESDTLFFQKGDGTRFTFNFEKDSVMGFHVDRFRADRIVN